MHVVLVEISYAFVAASSKICYPSLSHIFSCVRNSFGKLYGVFVYLVSEDY